ncbi:MAG: helix-turn-helix transcriptional regulator [Nocardioidaceae bacterium]|nr:helix-turn-helix transcriptional regulator [Nocardioidaceae bacterium]
MDEETAALAAAIGDRVRQQRAAQRWTLDRLADEAGISRRMVVNVEQGAANPSVATLLRLASALGVGLPALVEPPEQHAVTVTRAGTAPVLWRGDAGGRAHLVAATRTPEVVEQWDWWLGAGDRHVGEAHSPGTQELLHVLAGSVAVHVGRDLIRLGAGDAISFPGDVDHAYANSGDTTARFALTVFEPRRRRGEVTPR